MNPSPRTSPSPPLHLGLIGADAPTRRAVAQALAEALGLPCGDGPPPAAGGVSLQPLALRAQRDELRSARPALLLVRLPGAAEAPFDEPGADETVFTATAGDELARQVGALLPRLRRAAANAQPAE